MKPSYTGASLTVLICALAANGAALAQEASTTSASTAASSAESAASGPALADIVVTAQRREESSQKAAVAIAIVDSAALTQAQVSSPAQLTNLVPALQVSRGGGGTNVSIFLRGVGTLTANSYTDSAVAFNYDGVYVGRPNATTGYFYDVARLEVLKGPQGTLYGRNATGGAINVIPVVPRLGENEGFVTASLGNYDAVNLQAAVNIATSQNSALRIAGTYVDRDGYQSDGTTDETSRGIRGQFLIEPSEALSIRVSGDYFQRGGLGASSTLIAQVPINPFTNEFSIIPTGLPVNSGANSPGAAAVLASTFNGISGRTLLPLTQQSSLDGEFWGVGAEIGLKTGIGTFTMVAAHRAHETDDVNNGAGFLVVDKQNFRQDSLELRLNGSVGPIDYILGGFYYDDKMDAEYAPINQAINNYQSFVQTTKSLAGFGRLTYNVTNQLRLVGGLRYTRDRKALVGTSRTMIALCVAPNAQCPGAPLIPFSESADQAIAALGLLPAAPGVFISLDPAAANTLYLLNTRSVDSRLTNRKLTWRGAVEFDAGPANLLYASVETGFRSGGFSFSLARPSYDPETITAYTIGSKNRFFDNRVQLNIEGFYWKYRDQQLAHAGSEADGTPSFFTENVGGASVKGVEVEGQFALSRNTLLTGSVQYLDAKNDDFKFDIPATLNPILSGPGAPVYFPLVTGCATGGPVDGQWRVDCSGLSATRAPKWTMSFGIQQTVPLSSGARFIVNANTRYQSRNFTGFDQISTDIQGGYWTSNADLTFMSSNDKFSISAFVNNIENYRAKIYSQYFAATGLVGASYADPRTYGLRMTTRF